VYRPNGRLPDRTDFKDVDFSAIVFKGSSIVAIQWFVFAFAIVLMLIGGLWVFAARSDRDKVIYRVSRVSALLAALSITLAWKLEHSWCDYKDRWGLAVAAFWVAAPPLWFFFEYVVWPPPPADDERTRHFHDLARNLWLALVVILAAMMELKFPGAG
jgi:hypothetical protein